MSGRLAGKTALITGASSGQGAAEARLFAGEGARVVLCDVQDAAGEAMAKAIRDAGGKAEYRHLDVGSEAEWKATVDAVVAAHGGLHILVNNAGVSLRGVTLETTKLADWQRLLDVNLTGPWLGIKAVAPAMKAAGGGAIVNTGSTAGMNGHFATAYSVTKWGVRGLTKSAANEFAPWGIRVNAVHPGIVETPMVAGSDDFLEAMAWATPLERAASADEIATVVLFLASDEASFVTGIDLPVDGGFSASGLYRRVLLRVKESAGGRL
ncbi:MAG: SDR family NAD(P)-dependent oxidoreductase [Alphaproteobacteria bacterium]